MNLRICVPIHKGNWETVKIVLDDICTQDLSSCKNLDLEVAIIANGDAVKVIEPENLRKYPFHIHHEYFPFVHNAGQARDVGLQLKTKRIPDVIMYHDYDDNFYSNESLAILVNSYLENNAVITFGDSFIIDQVGHSTGIKYVDYSKFKDAKSLISNIIETLYFPFQSSLLDYQSCLAIGGFPKISTLEDRILIMKLLSGNSTWDYVEKYITNYVRHAGTLTEINTNTDTRKKVVEVLRKWNKEQGDNLYEEVTKC